MAEAVTSLDSVLVQIGDLGKYQILVFTLVSFAVVLHSAVHTAFVFTALDVGHRCAIPECDQPQPEFQPTWLSNAVPFRGTTPTKCEHYIFNSSSSNNDTCSANNFDRNRIVSCSSFVYKTEEKSILQEYNLQCDDNLWKLTMVGTLNSFGQLCGLFIGGIISDRYGRKVVLIWGMILTGVCGIIRAFMPTYEWFMFFEFLDAAFGAGTYICGFVLGVELVSPKRRVLTGIISSSCFAAGEVFTAASAWLVKSWKPLIFILYSPAFLLISYIWLVPESVRWHLSKGRLEEAKATLRKAAEFNGKELSENILEKLGSPESVEGNRNEGEFMKALKSTTLFLRLVNCCFCWITCTFLFYGLTLNSVSLAAGNSYLDFILTALIEIPAYICCTFMLDLMGRRKAVSGSYLVTGLACSAFVFVPPDSHVGSLTVYLIGKFGATAAFTNLYVITSEMFPTNLRHSFMGLCSTFGRIGSMLAPQMPILANIWVHLPVLSFSIMSFVAALLTLLFPETSDINLPDTIEEAENISQLSKKLPEKLEKYSQKVSSL
ncbi:solute carrier family 22 member 3 isoform X1 [Leptinotarsa decemlineata]|uniref:solute carrier family 22 member 3 isoform X1 n=1 Tax=Leptinotarsa decemlineata TaxID=7539 RepID=UPI003D3099C6